MIAEQRVPLATGDGVALEALVAPAPVPRGGLVACHPHPLHGGDMHNPVVVRTVEVAQDLGVSTIRFNFRGVGGSGGRHGGGRDAEGDISAAIGHLVALGTPAPRVLAGYSFGAAVAAAAAPAQPGITALALIAPPVVVMGASACEALAGWSGSILVVAASHDDYAPVDALEQLTERLPGARLAVVDGADHFFQARLHPMGEALRAWLAGLAG